MSSDSSGFQTNHQDSLTGLCRICGERARRKYEKTIPKLCVDYKSDIIQVYRLNINGDDIDRHHKIKIKINKKNCVIGVIQW